jgi:16S rRNA (guanine527-N7)-methyltransferase
MTSPEEFSRHLLQHFPSLSDQQVLQLYRHFELLDRWNKKLNLTAITGEEEAVARHYCESLFLGALLPPEPVSVADIGSGAGFPGIPMAVLRPDCRFFLIEAHQRKAVFLREATRHCSHVQVVAQRAEHINARFDWAVCRAVRPAGIAPVMARLATNIGFLISEAEVAQLARIKAIAWGEPVRLPWGERRLALLGRST